MNEWFRIIVYVLEHMLHKDKPLFDKPKIVDITISDGIRVSKIHWERNVGAHYVKL